LVKNEVLVFNDVAPGDRTRHNEGGGVDPLSDKTLRKSFPKDWRAKDLI